jgi:hypothetical protein
MGGWAAVSQGKTGENCVHLKEKMQKLHNIFATRITSLKTFFGS